MRITYLYLKNFKHIISGLNKFEVELNLKNSDKMVNVIIGKMGSCKTVILGHLQPYSSFGTLDSRNQDGEIAEDMDGVKIIEYSMGVNYYVIRHTYTWVKDHHTLKSYIMKNDDELNSAGNVSSFKSIIEIEFGINQNYLRLIRLGPNVTNLIDLKATDRKIFIGSMLSDVEIYSLLYKKINDEYKTNIAQANLLTNKLHSLTRESEDDIQSRLKDEIDRLNSLEARKEKVSTAIFSINAKNDVLLNGASISTLELEIREHSKEEVRLIDWITTTEDELKEYSSKYKSSSEVNKIIGGLEANLQSTNKEILEISNEYENINDELKKLVGIKKSSANKELLEDLQKNCDFIYKDLNDRELRLKDFKCNYNLLTVKGFLENIRNIDILISDVAQYNMDLIVLLYNANSSILGKAKKSIEIVTAKKMKLQREMNTLRFLGNYSIDTVPYLPPFCPTKSCPYYRTHPTVLQKENKKKSIDQEYIKFNNAIDNLDKEIYEYEDYPIIFNKIKALKTAWEDIIPKLRHIGVVVHGDLFKILTNATLRVWYDYDKIIDCMDLCDKRESYYELLEKYKSMKSELNHLLTQDNIKIDSRIEEISLSITKLPIKLEELEDSKSKIKESIKHYDSIYEILTNVESISKELEKNKERKESLSQLVSNKKDILEQIHASSIEYNKLSLELVNINSAYKQSQSQIDSIQLLLNEIKLTKKEFGVIQRTQDNLKYIIEAVSPNKGIPLIFVTLFLNNCKDTVNELVSGVFGETIEIEDFIITDTEFRIPYSINGNHVSDVSAASQGQRAIISLAISFSLMIQAELPYNIPLLDEMDGPLYHTDREKFIGIIFRYMQIIKSEQIFIVSHNNTFDGQSVNIIMTTEEQVDKNRLNTIMKI